MAISWVVFTIWTKYNIHVLSFVPVRKYLICLENIIFSETTKVSMEETLCTVEHGSFNCLAAVRMDYIGER